MIVLKVCWGKVACNTYQDFCESLLSSAKQCIPLGRRKNYVPCWDKERETLYRFFTRALAGTDSDRAASSLLSSLGQKKQERWEEAVNSIDFSHSSARRGAPSTHFKKRPLPALKYSNGRNCLTSVLAYHPFHHVPYQPVDEIFLSSLIQPKNSTAIQYLYLWFFNQTLGHSHVQWRS